MRMFFVVPFAIFSHLLFAGGFSGGGPPPAFEDHEALIHVVPDLGLRKLEVSSNEYRRTLMRLSVADFITISIDDDALIAVKLKDEAVIDSSEKFQVIPK